MSRPNRGIQSATEMLPLKGGGVLHIVLTAPRVCWVCVLLMHLFKKKNLSLVKALYQLCTLHYPHYCSTCMFLWVK